MGDDLDAVVWVADDRVFAGLDYGYRLEQRLRELGLRVGRRDLTRVRDAAPAAGLHVLSGGGTSVRDRSGWMRQALELTRTLVAGAHRDRHTVLGVCLGAQMLAEVVSPGSVRRGERIEAGLTEITWRLPFPVRVVVPAFHYEHVDRDQVVRAGAEVVAENPRALQGFRFGGRVWGVQFHPELEPADVRRLVAHHRHTIEAYQHTVDASRQSVDALEPAWDRGVFDRILDLVTAADR